MKNTLRLECPRASLFVDEEVNSDNGQAEAERDEFDVVVFSACPVATVPAE